MARGARTLRAMSDRTYFAACGRGLEPVLATELDALGVRSVVERRGGVAFRGDKAAGYRACLWLRSAIRVQEELLSTRVRGEDDLYNAVFELDWDRLLRPEHTLAAYASTRDAPAYRHSGHAAIQVKDAITDQQRQRHGERSSVDREAPDLPLKVVIQRDRLLLYRDLAGTSLHKRGYRPVQVKSPLNEVTAAGLLIRSEWDRASPLVDPMCGSGTFVIEAALLASDTAPGLQRTFAFERWVDFDADLWASLREEAKARAKARLGFALAGADRHAGAVGIAKQSAQQAGVGHLVQFDTSEARDWQPPAPPAFVVCNPPYGERLDDGEVEEAWRALGDFLKSRCSGAEAWVLSGNKAVTRFLRMRTSQRVPAMNGPIECRWLRYEIR